MFGVVIALLTRAYCLEVGEAEAVSKGYGIGQLLFVLDIGGRLHGVGGGVFIFTEDSFRARGQFGGAYHVIATLEAEGDGVVGVCKPGEVRLGALAGEVRHKVNVGRGVEQFHPVVVQGIDQGEVGEQLGAEDVVPAQGLGVVGKIHLHIYVRDVPVVHSEYVVAAEGAQVQAVVLPHYPVGLGVEVVEEQFVSLKSLEQREEHIQVGAPGSYHKAGLVLDNWAFYHCL